MAAQSSSRGGPAEGMEALYPFLYADEERDLDSVLAEVARSTVTKANEIVELRRSVLEREARRLTECATEMATRFDSRGRLFAFGNGGSSTDAQDVATTFLDPARGRPLPALALPNDVATVTALSNDIGYDVAFARQLAAFAREGDIAVGLSTSGGSANVVRALEEAGRRGMLTVGLAGYEGGKMAELDALDYLFVVPSASVHRIQEAQTTVYHMLWELTQHALGEATAGEQAGEETNRAAPQARHAGVAGAAPSESEE